MARTRAAVVLALAVCCLLVATAPARRPVDLPAADAVVLVDREAAAEPLRLRPRPVGAMVDCAEAAADEQGTAFAVPEDEDDDDAGRVEATSGGASALQVRPSSEETTKTVEKGWGWPAVSGKAEDDERRRPYDSESDSDSDDEDERGIFRWLWRLADHLV